MMLKLEKISSSSHLDFFDLEKLEFQVQIGMGSVVFVFAICESAKFA